MKNHKYIPVEQRDDYSQIKANLEKIKKETLLNTSQILEIARQINSNKKDREENVGVV